jgi:hypothetical protein
VNTILDYKGLKENFRATSLCVLKTLGARENSAHKDRHLNTLDSVDGDATISPVSRFETSEKIRAALKKSMAT